MVRKSGFYGLVVLGLAVLIASCGGSGGGGVEAGQILVRMSSLYGEGQILGAGPGEQVGLALPDISSEGSAAIWHDNTASPTLVPLNGLHYPNLLATDGMTRVGRAAPTPSLVDDEPWHAIKVVGMPAVTEDLHPAGFFSSEARGVSGDTIVGVGKLVAGGPNHPLMWKGSAVLDLLPAGAYSGSSSAAIGNVQAGGLTLTSSSQGHAGTWSGSADTFQDLNPAGYQNSIILGASATDFVGRALANGKPMPQNQEWEFHAFRWAGNSRMDLHPANAYLSTALATDGQIQVGYYSPNVSDLGLGRACLWRGTAASFVDLQGLLPAGMAHSRATGISGKIVSGWASDPNYEHIYPVIWVLP